MKSFKLKLKLNICTRGVFITENRRGLKPFEPDLVDTSVGKCVEPNINMSNGLFYFESVIYDSFTLRNFPSEGCVFFSLIFFIRRFTMAKTVLVTGASRGLGSVIARTLVAKGLQVVINYNQSQTAAEQLMQELGTQTIALQADVRNREQVNAMVASAIDHFGHIDAVVNNALVNFKFDPDAQKSFKDLSWDDYQAQLDGTLKASFNVIQSVLPQFIEHKQGSVVNIGTNLYQNPVVPYHEYTTAKASIIGFTRNIAAELGQYGITANVVSGGLLKTTDASAVTTPEVFDLIASTTPLHQVTSPQDVANMVVYLCSDEAKQITGQNITVDGGLTMN